MVAIAKKDGGQMTEWDPMRAMRNSPRRAPLLPEQSGAQAKHRDHHERVDVVEGGQLAVFDSSLEQVAIETIHVGDYVFVAPPLRPIGARCVLAKRAKANERTERIVGWLVDLSGRLSLHPIGLPLRSTTGTLRT